MSMLQKSKIAQQLQATYIIYTEDFGKLQLNITYNFF